MFVCVTPTRCRLITPTCKKFVPKPDSYLVVHLIQDLLRNLLSPFLQQPPIKRLLPALIGWEY